MPHPPELRALLAECRANPAEDLPRLVLADWLDERGESDRAQFIRLQLELAGMEWNSPRCPELKKATRALEESHPEWIRAFEQMANECRIPLPEGQRGPKSYFTSPPKAHWKRGLLTLDTFGDALSMPVFRAWLKSEEFDWVESISVQSNRPEAFVREDFPEEMFSRIDLSLYCDTATTDLTTLTERFRLLALSSNFTGVRGLGLQSGHNLIALEELTRADLTKLRYLRIPVPVDEIQSAASLIVAAPFENLAGLNIGYLDETALKILIRSTNLPRLVELPLSGCQIGDSGIQALAESRLANQLAKLEFANTTMTDAGLIAIVNSPLMERLKRPRLNLNMNRIVDAGLIALAQSEQLLNFTELSLRENHIGDKGIRALAESPYARELKHIDLWQNRIGDAGALALAASPYLDQIVDLSVKENQLTEYGVRVLQERFWNRVKC